MKKLVLLTIVFITFSIDAIAQRVYEDDTSITIVGVNVTVILTNGECGPVMDLDFGVDLKPNSYVLMKNQSSVFKCINQGGGNLFRIPFNYYPEATQGGNSMNAGFMLEKWGINKFDLVGGLFVTKSGTVDVQAFEQAVSRIKTK